MAEAPERKETEDRLAVGVAPADAQRLRVAIGDLLDKDAQPHQGDGRIWFPLLPDGRRAAEAALGGARVDDVVYAQRPFVLRTRRPTHYTALLSDLPAEEQAILPNSYDIVGDVAIIKLPEPLLAHKKNVGHALLTVHPNVSTVALDRGVTGELRVRDLEVIAGPPELTTLHREHGLTIEVALDKVYFSPRLATERQRLAARVVEGQRVLDLFAGVGAFVCLVARDRAPAVVAAVDLNPEAVRLLRRNLERNRIAVPVDAIEGDARLVAPRSGDWDHVVMNLPHDAAAFLDVAAECVAPDGEVHLYAMVERSEHDDIVKSLQDRMSTLMGAPWRVIAERHVRNYAPTMDGLGFTLSAADASSARPSSTG